MNKNEEQFQGVTSMKELINAANKLHEGAKKQGKMIKSLGDYYDRSKEDK
jgi:hypothetical protein